MAGKDAEDISQLPTNLLDHLKPDRDIHVVISIMSGLQQAQQYYNETLVPLLSKHKIQYTTHTTQSAQTIIELTRDVFIANANKGIKQTILLLSGDGGVIDIINTILSNPTSSSLATSPTFIQPTIVLLPMGTANALAWSLGVASSPLNSLFTGTPKPLPTFRVRFSPSSHLVVDEGRSRQPLSSNNTDQSSIMYGAVVFSWGLHASLVWKSDTAEYRRHGVKRFSMAAHELLQESHAYQGTVRYKTSSSSAGTTNWTTLTHSSPASNTSSTHSYIVATLVSNLEEHFCVSPETRSPISLRPRMVAIGPHDGSEIGHLLGLAYQGGKHIGDERVTYEEVTALRIEMAEPEEEWRMVCVDGKIVAVPAGGWVELESMDDGKDVERRVVDVVC